MPMHDWSKVGEWLFYQQHFGWVVAVSGALNRSTLPPRHYALMEYGDRLRGSRDPVEIIRTKSEGEHYFRKRRAISIRRAEDREYAAVIEILCPSVKSTRARLERFVQKVEQAITHGISVAVIDAYPPTPRDRNGIHDVLWRRLTGTGCPLPPGKPLVVASYSPGANLSAFVAPLAPGDVLPDVPLTIDNGGVISVPLESAYVRAWESFPDPLRPMVEGP